MAYKKTLKKYNKYNRNKTRNTNTNRRIVPNSNSKKRTFSRKDYMSGDGMLTSVWGPAAWHLLHTISFNYPIHPTEENKKEYKYFIESLGDVLPCKYCRMNLKNNLKAHPIKPCHMKNRDAFSRYIYNLHGVLKMTRLKYLNSILRVKTRKKKDALNHCMAKKQSVLYKLFLKKIKNRHLR